MDEKPNPDRRSFIKGRAAIDAIRARAEASGPDEAPTESAMGGLADRQSNYLEQYSKNAMACEFELLFNMHQYRQSGTAALAAMQLIDDLEDQLTVYRDHSEVSRINQTAFDRDVEVEPRLFDLLAQAKFIHEQTGRAFDITSGPLTGCWGFDQRTGKLPEPAVITTALETVGSEYIALDRARTSIRFTKSGVSINLGGIGKGHALDRVAELIESHQVHDFLIHGGQSSVLARGASLPTTAQNADTRNMASGWSIGVTHPALPSVRLGEIVLRNQALGTSGTGRQGFYHRGRRYGHIVDPRTGWPADHFLSTTVISPSAALSDALATAFFVMTLEEVEAFCADRPDVSALCISQKKTATGNVDLHPFNLNEDDWIRCV